jgi:hypothetical protein
MMDLSKSFSTIHCKRLAFLSFSVVARWISGSFTLLSCFPLFFYCIKIIPVQAPTGPEGSIRLRLPD